MARNNDRQDRSAAREEPELVEKLVGINRVAVTAETTVTFKQVNIG